MYIEVMNNAVCSEPPYFAPPLPHHPVSGLRTPPVRPHPTFASKPRLHLHPTTLDPLTTCRLIRLTWLNQNGFERGVCPTWLAEDPSTPLHTLYIVWSSLRPIARCCQSHADLLGVFPNSLQATASLDRPSLGKSLFGNTPT